MFEYSGKDTDVHAAVLMDCLENYANKNTRQLISPEKVFQEKKHNHSLFLAFAINIIYTVLNAELLL